MKTHEGIVLLLLAAGCVSSPERAHQDCQARTVRFQGMVDCLEMTLRPTSSAEQRYLATARDLAAQARNGTISEGKAYFDLARARGAATAQERRDVNRAVDRYLDSLPLPAPPAAPPPRAPEIEIDCRPSLIDPKRLECRSR